MLINVLIPMAGAGSRFSRAGYEKPKPFIDVDGKPMITRVLENLSCPGVHFILVARREHLLAEPEILNEIVNGFPASVVSIDMLTEGTACTVLFGRHYINNEIPLVIANSDQIVDFQFEAFVEDCLTKSLDGSILTFLEPSKDEKWSYAKTDRDGLVMEVKEKQAISERATVGIYMFAKGRSFVEGAIDMILHQDRVNNEYYTCPVYNYLIQDGMKIGFYDVPASSMHGIGTPEDLNAYLSVLREQK